MMTNSSTMKRRRSSAGGSPPNGGEESSAVGTKLISRLAKHDSEEDAWSSSGSSYINPFVHRLHIKSRIDLAKIYTLTVLLLPLRVFGCFLSLVTAWLFAAAGMAGISSDDLKRKPISGWRKQLQNCAACSMRLLYAFCTFHYVDIKGERASPKEAPILVVAPHSSYADSIIVVLAGPASIVAKYETSAIPLLGKIINFSQPIYVQREDPFSRQNTIREIVRRARSDDLWPQVAIFSEGTCTNRKALIKFKPGAFYAGVPVQPVLLKYPNKYDSFTWTWNGPGIVRLLWITLTQFYNRCEIQYLPVYHPSEEEKSDANLYAKNVRNVIAQALGIPTSEYSFEDVIMMNRAKELRVPYPGDIVEIEHSLYHLSLLNSSLENHLVVKYHAMSSSDNLDLTTFAELLQMDLKNTEYHKLFALLDHRHIGTVSLRNFLLCFFFCKHQNDEIIEFLRAIASIYSETSRKISCTSFEKILKHYDKLLQKKSYVLFSAIDMSKNGYISFDNFENYTKNLPEFKELYKKREVIRRNYKRV